MKKILFSLLAVAAIFSSCKKADVVAYGIVPNTKVTIEDNLFEDESIAVTTPKSAILGAMKMSEEQFNEAWTNGTIKFGARNNKDINSVQIGSTLGQGKFGHCFDVDGWFCTPEDPQAAICIEGTTSPFDYKIYGATNLKLYTGCTIICQQILQYTVKDKTQTIAVPWVINVTKGEMKIAATGKWEHAMTYDAGATPLETAIAYQGIPEKIAVDPATADAYAYFDNELLKGTKGTTFYFALDGTITTESDAVAVVYRQDGVWYFKLTGNSASVGQLFSTSIAFYNEDMDWAYVYQIITLVNA